MTSALLYSSHRSCTIVRTPTHSHLYTACIRVLADKYKAISMATVDLILLPVVDILSCSEQLTVGVIPRTVTLSTA